MAKQYRREEAIGILRGYGFKFYAEYYDNQTKTSIEVWSCEGKSMYLHILSAEAVFFAKEIKSHNAVLNYLREIE